MSSDQINQEAITWCFRRAIDGKHLTERTFKRLLKVILSVDKKIKAARNPRYKHGKMKVKHLIRKDEGATSVDIAKTELRDFQKVAKRYGVDFAVVKHKGSEPPVYSVFFKARDQDAIADVIRYYTEKKLMKEKRPSLHERIKQLKQKLAERPKKTRSKAKEKSR